MAVSTSLRAIGSRSPIPSVIASEAKHPCRGEEKWIASSQALLAMTGTVRLHTKLSSPATGSAEWPPDDRLRRGIQYAAASRFCHWRLWNTGSPAFAGDDNWMCIRDLATHCARGSLETLRPRKSEGAGNAGCALHPRSRAQCAQRVRARAYRAAENIRHSLRNGFTAYFELSLVTGFLATIIGGT